MRTTNQLLSIISIVLTISFLFSGCGGNIPTTEFAPEQTTAPVLVPDTPTVATVPTITVFESTEMSDTV